MRSSPKIVLAVFRSRGVLFLCVAGSCLAAALGYAILGADHYRAVATLFLDPSSFDAVPAGGGAAARGSEIDLLRSERVAQRVAENERLVEAPALRALYLQSIDAGRPPLEAIAQYLADHVDATSSDDGGMVRLAVTLGDPELAAQVANAYAQAWGEVNLELRTASIRNGVERAHEDLVSLRARLGEARARLSDGSTLAAAGSRADEQFAQLSRWSTRSLGQASPGGAATAGAETVAGAMGRSAGGSLMAEPAVNLHYEGGARDDSAVVPAGAGERWDSMRAGDVNGRRGAGARGGAATSADDEIRLAQQSLERAEERLARLSAEGVGAPFPAHLLRPARVPDTSTKPGAAVCAALGAALGVVLGLVAMLLGEFFDRRIRRPADLARGTGIVVLGNLPASRSAATAGVQGRARLALRLARGRRAIV